MSESILRIGTRGSALALWQAREAAARLGVPHELVTVETTGDRVLDEPLQGRLEKGFFTREIEERLLSKEIDVAVHSLKDLPTESPQGLVVAAYLPRACVEDLLLVHPDWHEPLGEGEGEEARLPLREGCLVGAGSLRRQALLAAWAPGARVGLLRGNVPTRIRKCVEGGYGAIVMARAGIERLEADLGPLKAYELNREIWLPAPGQGAIALQAREGDETTLALLARADHGPTRQAVAVERNLLARFEGGCHTAFGAHAEPLPDGGFQVRVGLEVEGWGWVQASFAGSQEECLRQGPKTLDHEFCPETLDGRWLCRPYTPSS